MLNENTIKALQSINNITNSIVLKHPVTCGISESSSTLFKIDLSEFDSDSFNPIYLNNNLDKFLSLFRLFKNYNVSFNNDICVIKSDRSCTEFITSDPLLMKMYDVSDEMFTKLESVPNVCEFDLSSNNIREIRSANGVLKELVDVIFHSESGIMKVLLGNMSSWNARSDTYSLSLDSTPSKDFKIKISSETFSTLPLIDYNVKVKYSESRNKFIIVMKAKDFKCFELVLSVMV